AQDEATEGWREYRLPIGRLHQALAFPIANRQSEIGKLAVSRNVPKCLTWPERLNETDRQAQRRPAFGRSRLKAVAREWDIYDCGAVGSGERGVGRALGI